MLFELRRQTFRHGLERNSGGVRRYDGSGSSHFFDALQQVLFNFQILNHNFDDPVHIRELAKIILHIADGDSIHIIFVHQQRGAGYQHGIQSGFCDPIAGGRIVLFFSLQIGGNDVEEQGVDAGTGKQRRNTAPHNTGAKHSRSSDLFSHIDLLGCFFKNE